MIWKCRQFTLDLSRPRVMGIVNVTPDSFSDGGRFLDPSSAVARAENLVRDGADILDIGGESTRPGHTPVSAAEEADRILPVLERLSGCGVPISVDTRRTEVARAALAAGAAVINSVTPPDQDPTLAQCAAEAEAGYVAVADAPRLCADLRTGTKPEIFSDIRIFRELESRSPSHVIFDPGIGFGTTRPDDLMILGAVRRLACLGPVLIGVSRKRIIGILTGEDVPDARLGGSVGVAVWCAMNGAAVLRVHDVKETRQALDAVAALEGATL